MAKEYAVRRLSDNKRWIHASHDDAVWALSAGSDFSDDYVLEWREVGEWNNA